jgi:hypothetical protein
MIVQIHKSEYFCTFCQQTWVGEKECGCYGYPCDINIEED